MWSACSAKALFVCALLHVLIIYACYEKMWDVLPKLFSLKSDHTEEVNSPLDFTSKFNRSVDATGVKKARAKQQIVSMGVNSTRENYISKTGNSQKTSTTKKMLIKKSRVKQIVTINGGDDSSSSPHNSSASTTTVVSVYFAFRKSKHTHERYDGWVRNMLTSVRSPLVMFIDPQSLARYKDVRTAALTTFIVYESVWDMLYELEAERNHSYVRNYQRAQHRLDREKKLHNPHLYAVWNLKAYMVSRVLDLNPYSSRFFIYTDAGSWRYGPIPGWPDATLVQRVSTSIGDRVLFGQISAKPNLRKPWHDAIQGNFFAGNERAMRTFYTVFYAIHDRRLDRHMFIGLYNTAPSVRFCIVEHSTHKFAGACV